MTKVFQLGHARALHFHLLAALLLVGCSSSDGTNAGSAGAGGGQVTDQWSGFCTATFKNDVAIQDAFGDTAFTARAGEQYLLTEFDTFAGQPRVRIAYLTPLGPDIYSVPVSGSADTFPFTSSCTIDNTDQYVVAFTNVAVYGAEDLATKICDISAGTALPRDTTAGSGSSIAGALNFSGPQTYDVMLNAFSAQCGNATDGFVSVPETKVLGVNTWLIPIDVLLKAK